MTAATALRDTDFIVRPVVLVRGPIFFAQGAINNEATPAIALAYIASYIEAFGYRATIVDGIAEGINQIWPLENYPGFNGQGLTFEKIIERIPTDAAVVGFSGMFSSEWPFLRDLITMTRERFRDAILIAGGEHVTAETEYSLRDCPALDLCIRGEGEAIFLSVLEALRANGNYSDVDGIGFIDATGAYRENAGLQRIRQIDDIPWPIWPEGYMEKFWRAGKSFGVGTERDMPFLVSRGCPYRCTFCSNENMWTTRYILRDIEEVVGELKTYIERYDITSVQLYDLTAIVKKRWLLGLAQRLKEEGIQIEWSIPSGTRSEALDGETLLALREMGCRYLVYAPESAAPTTLERIKKRINLDNLTASVKNAKKLGFTVRLNLIIGFPDESWKEMWQTVWYGLKMSAYGVDEAPLYIYSPYPGTLIFEQLLAEGKIVLGDNYFFKLSALNSAYLSSDVICFNDSMNARVLGLIRLAALLTNYGVSYLFYPNRIVRTLKNVFGSRNRSFTVFEHRLRDMVQR